MWTTWWTTWWTQPLPVSRGLDLASSNEREAGEADPAAAVAAAAGSGGTNRWLDLARARLPKGAETRVAGLTNSIVVRGERQSQAARRTGIQPPEALEFVRFCYRRRRVQWPEIYDEMCAVASRGDFNGWGFEELAEHGILFTIDQLPDLTALVQKVAQEDEVGQGDDTEQGEATVRPSQVRNDVSPQAQRGARAVGPGGSRATATGWPMGRIRASAS
jgi:hypothetical protein